MFVDKKAIKLYKTTENMSFWEEDVETVIARITSQFTPITCTTALLQCIYYDFQSKIKQ